MLVTGEGKGLRGSELMPQKEEALEQIDTILATAADSQRFITRALAALDRLATPGSPYRSRADASEGTLGRADTLREILLALRDDIADGYLRSFRAIVHAELFSEYLEQADYLNSEGYKDAAAVIAGSTLEHHLRQLCSKYSVPTRDAKGRAVKADQLNAELAKAGAYSKPEQKQVTAWLGLRNEAAHGHYEEYEASQVVQMIGGIRDFIVRNSA